MASVAPMYEDRRMSVGRVFQRAFSAIAYNPVVILGLALVVGALPGLIFSFAFVQLGLGPQSELDHARNLGSGSGSPHASHGFGD
jgi:hypothetical protein